MDSRNTQENNQQLVEKEDTPPSIEIATPQINSGSLLMLLEIQNKKEETKLKSLDIQGRNQLVSQGIQAGGQVLNAVVTGYFASKSDEHKMKQELEKNKIQLKREKVELNAKIQRDQLLLQKETTMRELNLKEKELELESSFRNRSLQIEERKIALEESKFSLKKEKAAPQQVSSISMFSKQSDSRVKQREYKATSISLAIINLLNLDRDNMLASKIKEFLVDNPELLGEIVGQAMMASFVEFISTEIKKSIDMLLNSFDENQYILDDAVILWRKEIGLTKSATLS